MMTAAQGRAQRKALMREIAREERKKQRAELVRLRAAIKDARRARKAAMKEARAACRLGRGQARERAREIRKRLQEEIRELVRRERANAKHTCEMGLASARGLGSLIEQRRGKLAAERAYRAELRRIERGNKDRRRELARSSAARRGERRQESDDEVRAGIPPELVGLWERVKRSIRGSERMTRTESFLKYAEEHPSEVLVSIEDRTEEVIRELEARQREVKRSLRRPIPRHVYASTGTDVPF